MLFNSYIFIFAFLPITFFIYFYLNAKRMTTASKAFLIFASLFFYSWWNIAYLPIILVSILFNYTIGISLSQNKGQAKVTKRSLLTFGIAANIALLGYFKYTDFLIENINWLTDGHTPLLHLALPLAISFFTFQQIAYLVDSYKGETNEHDFLNYTIFVTFFPQLIAGPIVHHAEMMPQFSKVQNKIKNNKNIAKGLFVFSIGLFKKVIIADSFAIWATQGFDVAEKLNLIEAWVTSLSYTFQLYFDFSGYTDMAIGAALLFNIKLPANFHSPYKATSVEDFWRRWHITLSRFLRDYIYIPMGGNRNGRFRTYMNLMATFIIGGIWHGAGWTFVFWGLLHGIALILQKIWNHLGFHMHTLLAWFVTFNFINIAWIFFRAKEWDDAMKVFYAMFNVDAIVLPESLSSKLGFLTSYGIMFGEYLQDIDVAKNTIAWLFLGFVFSLSFKNTMEKAAHFKLEYKSAIFTAILFLASLSSLNKTSEFLYFNF